MNGINLSPLDTLLKGPVMTSSCELEAQLKRLHGTWSIALSLRHGGREARHDLSNWHKQLTLPAAPADTNSPTHTNLIAHLMRINILIRPSRLFTTLVLGNNYMQNTHSHPHLQLHLHLHLHINIHIHIHTHPYIYKYIYGLSFAFVVKISISVCVHHKDICINKGNCRFD